MAAPAPPTMMRFGVSPRACWAMWVEGWKKWSRSQAARSFAGTDARVMALVLSGEVEADIFQVGEGFEAVAGALAAEAGLLHPAERDGRAGDLHPVDGHHAAVQRPPAAQGAPGIPGHDI